FIYSPEIVTFDVSESWDINNTIVNVTMNAFSKAILAAELVNGPQIIVNLSRINFTEDGTAQIDLIVEGVVVDSKTALVSSSATQESSAPESTQEESFGLEGYTLQSADCVNLSDDGSVDGHPNISRLGVGQFNVTGSVVLCEGVYSFSLGNGQSLFVFGGGGDFVLDCNGSDLVNSNSYLYGYGARFDGGDDDVTLTGCNFSEFQYGVYVYGSSSDYAEGLLLNDTVADGCQYGVYVYGYADGLVMDRGVFKDNRVWGVYLRSSNHISINSSNITGNGKGGNGGGVYLYYCDYGNITGCNISDNTDSSSDYGLNVYSGSDYWNIYNNIIVNSYNNLEAYTTTNTFNTSRDCTRTNIVGGSCVGGNYYGENIFIDHGQGQGDYSTQGDGIGDDLAYPVEYGTTTRAYDYLPLTRQTSGCTTPFTRQNLVTGNATLCTGTHNINALTNGQGAFTFLPGSILNCAGSTIQGSNSYYGIYLTSTSDNVRVKNCKFKDYAYGIYGYASNSDASENFEVIDSDFESCAYHGLYFYQYINNFKVLNSEFKDNGAWGVYLRYSNHGVLNNSNVTGNGLSGNGGGVYLTYADYCNITRNNVSSNGDSTSDFGVYVYSGSDYNKVYDNIIVNPYNNLETYPTTNSFNISRDCSRTNVVGGSCVGGNYYGDGLFVDHGLGQGVYSNEGDGIGDDLAYPVEYGTTTRAYDYLPLTKQTSGCATPFSRQNLVVGNATLCSGTHTVTDLTTGQGAFTFQPGTTLDCGSSIIQGSDAYYGIYLTTTSDNLKIRNCYFNDYAYGVYGTASSSNYIENIQIENTVINSTGTAGVYFYQY
ncbi:MAG: hypothetical protein DRO11_08945, partial [Methanobacteriota archaeon]